jgi:outer membrane receptor for ferrienterochelin and colicin
MRNIFIYIVLFTISLQLNAQHSGHDDHNLHGHVFYIDDLGNKKVLPYANVYWLSTNSGVISDSTGSFILHKPHDEEDLRIVASFVGYNTDTLTVDHDQEHIEIILQEALALEEVTVVKNQATNVTSRINLMPTQIITEAGLQKLACCNIGESFESNATVDVGFTDAVSGAKKIKMLGLDGKYSQFMFENIPFMRTLESGYGLSHIPGPFMESIQVSKGTSSVLNGYESTTGQINVEYKKPQDTDLLFVNLFANTEGRYESNITSGIRINDKWSTGLFFHGSLQNLELDHNSDGFMDKPLTQQLNFLSRWEYDPNDLLHLQFGVEVLDEYRMGGQLGFDGFDNNTDGLYGIDIDIQKARFFGKLGYAFPNKPYQSMGWINSFTWFDQNSRFGDRVYNGNVKSYYSNLIFQTIIKTTDHNISSGVSFQYDDYSEFFLGDNYNRQEFVPGVFSQYTWSIPEKSVFMAGMRADYNSIHGMLFTPRLHWKYSFTEDYILRTTLGKAYRSANVFTENLSLLASSRQFNLDESFEIESAWNAGISFSRYFHMSDQREGSLTVDFYRTEFQNQGVVDVDHDISEVNIFNLDGQSYSNSFQADLTGEFISGFDLTLAYRFNDVKADYLDGLRERPFVYRHKALFTTTYSTPFDKWSYDLTVQYNGASRIPDTEMNPEALQMENKSPDFFVVHSQLTRRFKTWDLYVGAENLTGFRQENAIIAPDNPFGENFDATMIWGPLTGRMFYAGIRFKIR